MDPVTVYAITIAVTMAVGFNLFGSLFGAASLSAAGYLPAQLPTHTAAQTTSLLAVLGMAAVVEGVVDTSPAGGLLRKVEMLLAPGGGAMIGQALAGGSAHHVSGAALAGVAVALIVHGTRTAARPVLTAIRPSTLHPLVSILEDTAALILLLLAVTAPYVAVAGFVACLLIAFLLLRKTVRLAWRAGRAGTGHAFRLVRFAPSLATANTRPVSAAPAPARALDWRGVLDAAGADGDGQDA